MGCWQETCALTLLPIYEDQPCVMVVMNSNFTKRDPMMRGFAENADEVEAIHRGPYSDYGWIKGVEKPKDRDEIFTIFFHASVWDKALQAGLKASKEWAANRRHEAELHDALSKFSQHNPSIFTKKPPVEDSINLYAVAIVGFSVRRDLFGGDRFRGSQVGEIENYDLIHKAAQELMEEIKKAAKI